MTLPIVETKLVPARHLPEVVVRQRLLDRLDRLASASVTLVDAPVGFGKTTLVASWCARAGHPIAWVSLDAGDDDPTRLWTYVATSVDRIRSGLGRPALARLRVAGAPPEPAVDELVNALTGYGEPLAIVLDDLHVLANDACLGSLEHALERLPPNARVVATSRSDPRIHLGRLRARGLLGEIRARELAFTPYEARELLVEREGVRLDDRDVELLVERTEGWPAGLYLAALWLRELDDPGGGVEAFHGDHRHVADYLTSEVLDVLDEETRRFMLESSTFGTFTARLCDAVLERADSAERLRELERSNGFLVALDAQGDWYRYHQLFGELLELELETVEPGAAAALHARASAWCLREGLLEDALTHADASGDLELVARILADEHLVLLRSGRLETVLHWCSRLPEDALLEHPVLGCVAGLAAGLLGRSVHVRRRFITLAERARDERPGAWTPYEEAALGLARATWVEDDLGKAVGVARRTVAVGREVPEIVVPALASLAFLLYLTGEHEEARSLAEEAVARPEATARPHGLVLALATLSLVETDDGRPAPGESHAREALRFAAEGGVDLTASGGAACVALAAALAAQTKLSEAERLAIQGERLRSHPEPEAGHLHALLVLAGIRARRGRLEHAAEDLDRAERGLETFHDPGRLTELAAAVERTLATARTVAGAVAEKPSTAELGVLRLLATDLTQREIGRSLFLSLNTVKTHTRALYRKLGAASREEAVERATALGLLDETADSPG